MTDDRKPPGTDPSPSPDAEATAAEKAHADSFGRLVDDLLAGESLPPAMDADERELIEVATMIVAGSRDVELDADRTRSIIDDVLPPVAESAGPALKTVAGPKRPGVRPAQGPAPADITDLAEVQQRRAQAALPWAITAIAIAAAVLLFVTRPAPNATTTAAATPTAPTAAAEPKLAPWHRSRPADPLVGRIPRSESGNARARLDTIYSDRLTGYRELALSRPAAKGGRRR